MECGPHTVTVEGDVAMTTRDGVILRADVYRPDGPGPFPVLLRRTPYGKRLNDLAAPVNEAHLFASHGYLVVVQDTRGRWASDGVFRPFFDEGEDGYDAVEWAAGLTGSTGDVGTFGQSYGALCQYLTAPLRPPHLRTAIPVSAPISLFRNCVYRDGVFELDWMLKYIVSMAQDDLRKHGRHDEAAALDQYLLDASARFSPLTDEALRHLPLRDWGERLAGAAPYFAEYLAHPFDDPYWAPLDVVARTHDIDIPILHVGSWYDAFQYDSLALYSGASQRARTTAARDGQALLMGPWAHLLPYSVPTSKGTGDIDFGPEAAVDLLGIERAWFDRHLKGHAGGEEAGGASPVRIFVMGENRWRDEPAWPPPSATPTPWYLHAGGCFDTVPPAGDEPADSFRYDPADPVPTRGGHVIGPLAGVADQRPIEARPDVLVYTSDPLPHDLELTGPVRVLLHASSSAPDTDFTATLVDVRPDGYAHNLVEGIVRARLRESATGPSLLEPGKPYALPIDLWAVSHVVKAGHRVRLDVSSSSFPRWDRNPNSGAPFGADAELRVADQTVFHDAARPSHVVLPVVTRG